MNNRFSPSLLLAVLLAAGCNSSQQADTAKAADTAAHADNATHADSAAHADTAAHADSATHADTATQADTAASTPWSGITGLPAWAASGPPQYTADSGVVLQGTAFSLAPTVRKIYYTATSLAFTPNATVSPGAHGLVVTSASSTPLELALTQPADFVKGSASSLSVTLYFAIPSASTAGDFNWRLRAGGNEVNLPAGSAGTGWDSLDYYVQEDGTVATYASPSSHTNVVKSQTWTAKWSSTYNTWYFGSGVSTANSFSSNTFWHFAFVRGKASANGETNTSDFVVLGVEVAYTASR